MMTILTPPFAGIFERNLPIRVEAFSVSNNLQTLHNGLGLFCVFGTWHYLVLQPPVQNMVFSRTITKSTTSSVIHAREIFSWPQVGYQIQLFRKARSRELHRRSPGHRPPSATYSAARTR